MPARVLAVRIGPLALLALAAAWAVHADVSGVDAQAGERRASSAAVREPEPPGAKIFRQRCALCHSTGDGAGRGPGLGGVVGRKAAAAGGFAYSRALRESGLTWDRATLDRFLTSPAALVPGTLMPMIVPDPDDRRVLIDYLASVSVGQRPSAVVARASDDAAPHNDYRTDAPGVRRRVSIADLPPPFATPSASNGPGVVDPPPGVRPRVPAGFAVDRFASDLEGPRLLRVAPNGDVFVAESARGTIRVLRAADGANAVEHTSVFVSGLDRPFGIAFYPPGPKPRWVYVAETNAVLRFEYRSGDLEARGPRQTVVPSLTSLPGGHWTRDIAFSPDGRRLFVSVGSGSNVAEGMEPRSPDEVAAWEHQQGLGAAWDDERDRADVLEFDPDGGGRRVFATGIRNCVGLSVHPTTGDVWCSTNERDGLGDDLVPDYVTRVRPGAFYGWPWYYLGNHEDPRHAGERPDLVGRITLPDVLLQAHSAPLEHVFYDGAMFPPEFRGNIFVALHGSWNRANRTGPKVVRLPAARGVPSGDYEDFMTGFTVDDANVWGRPVGVAVAHDGALLVSEDANGTVWRVSYRGAGAR